MPLMVDEMREFISVFTSATYHAEARKAAGSKQLLKGAGILVSLVSIQLTFMHEHKRQKTGSF